MKKQQNTEEKNHLIPTKIDKLKGKFEKEFYKFLAKYRQLVIEEINRSPEEEEKIRKKEEEVFKEALYQQQPWLKHPNPDKK